MERYKYYIRHIFPSIFLIILIVILLVAVNNNSSLTYEYNDKYDGYIVKEAKGNVKSYTIPENYNDKPVIGIGVRAFYKHNKLEEVIFEKSENIKLIDRLSFSECENLKSIDLKYVKEIGNNAFSYDKSLDNIELSLDYILASTFYKCESLSNIKLNEGVKTIGSFAFSYINTDTLYLPSTIITVYTEAFKYANINKIVAPARLNYGYMLSLENVEYY